MTKKLIQNDDVNMTLRTRRIIYLSCILIFALTAPPLVLYTTGFRYDWEYRRLVETGSLVIKSQPAGATIYLNGRLHQATTPTIINNILPGKINLEVKKDGYHVWQKNLNISPRLTTFAENIKLFLTSRPQTYLPAPVTNYWWNAKQDKLIYSTGRALRLYNTLNQKNTLITTLNRAPALTILWSPTDDRFILSRGAGGNLENFIVDALAPEKFTDLNAITPEPLKNIQWDPLAPDTVYGLGRAGLYRVPYLIKTARLIKPGNILNYALKNDKIIILQKSATGINLVYFAPSDPTTVLILTERLEDGQDEFLNTNSHRVALYHKTQKSLTIFDPTIKATNPELAIIEIPDVDKAIWSRDGSRLVYTAGGAIYQRSFIVPIAVIPAPRTAELITRYSQTVTDVFWSDDETYLFYAVADSLRVLEITPSTAPRSLILLTDLAQAKAAAFISNPATITFIDKDGALMLLPLTEKQSGTFFFGR